MYHIIKCPLIKNEENGGVMVELDNCFELAGISLWKTGSPLDPDRKKNIPNPVELEFDTYFGYNGSPPEMKDLCIPVMSTRLSDVLISAGVNNVEFFPAILKNRKTNQAYEYKIYNIVGKVAATDLKKSDYETYHNEQPLADTTIHKLVLDESKIHNLLFFRLAEKLGTIIVHEKIKKHIEDAKIDTIRFIKPDEFASI